MTNFSASLDAYKSWIKWHKRYSEDTPQTAQEFDKFLFNVVELGPILDVLLDTDDQTDDQTDAWDTLYKLRNYLEQTMGNGEANVDVDVDVLNA